MPLGIKYIEWMNSVKYLGVTTAGGNSLGFNNGPVKQSFFSASITAYNANAKQLDERLHLALHENYSLPTYLCYRGCKILHQACRKTSLMHAGILFIES